jgi:uncharacterized Fe-S center protein
MSEVLFASLRAESAERSFLRKIKNLASELIREVKNGDLVAIKLHFGELGNHGFLRPVFVRQVVDLIKDFGGKPFLTDTNTLYKGSRSNAIGHLNTAIYNGFSYASIGCPIIIADGIRGQYFYEIEVNLKHFKKVKIGGAILDSDYLVVLTHFKGHMSAGFGGSIKNVAMGCASRAGKQQQHADFKPPFIFEKCIGCGKCEKVCPEYAITILNKKASFDYSKCIGCGECVTVCPTGAIKTSWGSSSEILEEKMVEYAYGVKKYFEDRISFLNFVVDVSPDCDCLPWHDLNLVPDIGVFGSKDIVSVDQASFDSVKKSESLKVPSLNYENLKDEDKFYHVHKISGIRQLEYGEEIGLGERKYNIIEI